MAGPHDSLSAAAAPACEPPAGAGAGRAPGGRACAAQRPRRHTRQRTALASVEESGAGSVGVQQEGHLQERCGAPDPGVLRECSASPAGEETRLDGPAGAVNRVSVLGPL